MEHSANLAPVRGPNVWSRGDLSGAPRHTTPQKLLGAAGFGLLAAALARQRRRRGLMFLGGVSLLALASSRDDVRDVRDWIRHRVDAWRAPDHVSEASELSFPASDSPSWTSTVGSGAPDERAGRS
jgi:hypothetical protein